MPLSGPELTTFCDSRETKIQIYSRQINVHVTIGLLRDVMIYISLLLLYNIYNNVYGYNNYKTNNQMKSDVKLHKLAKVQLQMLNVRRITALTVRHYANVILWYIFLPMGLKGLTCTLIKLARV